MNLQRANHVVFVHPFVAKTESFAPAWEAQAVGRCHRPGQSRQVHVHRFVALRTLEHEIRIRAELKGWDGYGWQVYFEKVRQRAAATPLQ